MNKKNLRIKKSLDILKNYYLNDDRPYCIAYSGGKDSSAIVFLTVTMLLELKAQGIPLDKEVFVVSSNTTAELPTLIDHLDKSLESIQVFANKYNLPIEATEVRPLHNHTLNSAFLGVGMPPPTGSLRWCTDKLKIKPIDTYIVEKFPDGRFITITGSRRDESDSRSKRLQDLSVDEEKTDDLKRNDRYPEANSLAPIEYWNTKDVWEYMFDNESDLIDVNNLWKVYSDASDKEASECSFVGAGGKNIDEGKLGCGTSRFGCWQCYVTRGQDKCLDGLLESGLPDIDHYLNYRTWFWNETQKPWEITRDYYSHRYFRRELYDRAKNKLVGGSRPSGLNLTLRRKAFFKIMKLNNTITGSIISKEEVIFIQERWLKEGDYNLTAIKICKIVGFELDKEEIDKFNKPAKEVKRIYKELLSTNFIKPWFKQELKRYAAQYILNKAKLEKQFYPSKIEALTIRREWKNMVCEDVDYVYKNNLHKLAYKYLTNLGLFS